MKGTKGRPFIKWRNEIKKSQKGSHKKRRLKAQIRGEGECLGEAYVLMMIMMVLYLATERWVGCCLEIRGKIKVKMGQNSFCWEFDYSRVYVQCWISSQTQFRKSKEHRQRNQENKRGREESEVKKERYKERRLRRKEQRNKGKRQGIDERKQ